MSQKDVVPKKGVLVLKSLGATVLEASGRLLWKTGYWARWAYYVARTSRALLIKLAGQSFAKNQFIKK